MDWHLIYDVSVLFQNGLHCRLEKACKSRKELFLLSIICFSVGMHWVDSCIARSLTVVPFTSALSQTLLSGVLFHTHVLTSESKVLYDLFFY